MFFILSALNKQNAWNLIEDYQSPLNSLKPKYTKISLQQTVLLIAADIRIAKFVRWSHSQVVSYSLENKTLQPLSDQWPTKSLKSKDRGTELN